MARRFEPYETSNSDVAGNMIANNWSPRSVYEDETTSEVVFDFGDDPVFRSSVAAVADKMPPRPRHILDAARAKVESLTTAARRERRQAATDAAVADWQATIHEAERAGIDRADFRRRWKEAVRTLDAAGVAAIGEECQRYLASVEARRERTAKAIERLREIQSNA